MNESPWGEMAQALLDLEHALRGLALWTAERPAAQRLNSTTPFCVDTLRFEEWLQWVFIPRMGEIAVRRERLSFSAVILPMGEQGFAHLGRRQQALLSVLAHIDRLSQKLLKH